MRLEDPVVINFGSVIPPKVEMITMRMHKARAADTRVCAGSDVVASRSARRGLTQAANIIGSHRETWAQSPQVDAGKRWSGSGDGFDVWTFVR